MTLREFMIQYNKTSLRTIIFISIYACGNMIIKNKALILTKLKYKLKSVLFVGIQYFGCKMNGYIY